MPFQSINPTTEEPLRSYPQMSDREVEDAGRPTDWHAAARMVF